MENYLVHHGIDGQKWGVRNGPPYPLDASQKSPSEKKARRTVKKINRVQSRSDKNKYVKYKKNYGIKKTLNIAGDAIVTALGVSSGNPIAIGSGITWLIADIASTPVRQAVGNLQQKKVDKIKAELDSMAGLMDMKVDEIPIFYKDIFKESVRYDVSKKEG